MASTLSEFDLTSGMDDLDNLVACTIVLMGLTIVYDRLKALQQAKPSPQQALALDKMASFGAMVRAGQEQFMHRFVNPR